MTLERIGVAGRAVGRAAPLNAGRVLPLPMRRRKSFHMNDLHLPPLPPEARFVPTFCS